MMQTRIIDCLTVVILTAGIFFSAYFMIFNSSYVAEHMSQVNIFLRAQSEKETARGGGEVEGEVGGG